MRASELSSLTEEERDLFVQRAVAKSRLRYPSTFHQASSSSQSQSIPLTSTTTYISCASCGRQSTITCGKCLLYNYCSNDCLQTSWQGYVKCINFGTEKFCACTYCYGKSIGRSISTDPIRFKKSHKEVCRRLSQGVSATIRAKAGLGEANSLSLIGDYFRTRDDDPDFVKSAEFYKRAASKNDAKAAFYLGIFYKKGLGVKINPDLMIHYWIKAAGEGANADAQYYLGLEYISGENVPCNLKEAKRWLTLASISSSSSSIDKEKLKEALTLCNNIR